MKYIGIICRIDGQPDSSGEVLGPNVELPPGPILVSQDFNKDLPPLGTATVSVAGKDIIAIMDIDLMPTLATKCYAVPGGYVKTRESLTRQGAESVPGESTYVREWSINHVAITTTPCDKTLEPLKEYPAESPGVPRIKFRTEIPPEEQ